MTPMSDTDHIDQYGFVTAEYASVGLRRMANSGFSTREMMDAWRRIHAAIHGVEYILLDAHGAHPIDPTDVKPDARGDAC